MVDASNSSLLTQQGEPPVHSSKQYDRALLRPALCNFKQVAPRVHVSIGEREEIGTHSKAVHLQHLLSQYGKSTH